MDSKGKTNEQTKDYDKGDKPQEGGLAANGGSMIIAVSENILYRMEEQGRIPKPGPAFPFVKALVRLNRYSEGNIQARPSDIVLMTKTQERAQDLQALKRLSRYFEGIHQARPFNIVLMTNTQEKVQDVQDALGSLVNSSGDLMTNTQERVQDLQDALRSLGLSSFHIEEEDIKKLQQTKEKETKILYLTEDADSAETAIDEGLAAAIMFPDNQDQACDEDGFELRVAFDGDGVLFSDQSEGIYKRKGLEAFIQNEKENQAVPLNEGPLKCFLEFLHGLQKNLQSKRPDKVTTYLVTSRNPIICGMRALNTLTSWDSEVSQAFFMSSSSKGPNLATIRPHIFFDDQMRHIDAALQHGVIAALVPYGIRYRTSNPAKKPRSDK